MSARNGDKARHQKNRRRVLKQRVRIRELVKRLRDKPDTK